MEKLFTIDTEKRDDETLTLPSCDREAFRQEFRSRKRNKCLCATKEQKERS